MALYAWGANSSGQLGLGHQSDSELKPQKVDLKGTDLKPEEIISIAGGGNHTLILDTNGLVYCCGGNSKEFKVVQISCGWDFSAAVCECGKQFVWGNNQYTQLGLSKSITCTGIPSRLQVSLKLASGFKQVSCGLRHSAMITKDGELLVAGTGSKGQLGSRFK
ncbi:hypothetical protein GWI33_005949 [Rhynchophorus ferrugineus]|uniref:Secretion-regulating guanine nucleotide exchange factor n=1 Tax=Rhynchophorus ferrugineus TaxID=354439 RepID=A0A834MLH9_RHYFE|nr:hypothetical protein GWI33_005949 [Rhynchophorus ferrugineus]